MILMLSTLLFSVFVNCGGEKMLMSEDNISSNRVLGNFKVAENTTGHLSSIQHEEEIVPNYLQSGFHDFESSDQGLTYNYEASKTKPKLYKKFRSQNLGKQSEHQSYKSGFLLSTPDDKLAHGIGHKTTVPVKMHSESLKNKYTRQEDRLSHGVRYMMAKTSNTYPENHDLSVADVRLIRGGIKHRIAKPLHLENGYIDKIENRDASAVDFRLVHDIKGRKTKPLKPYLGKSKNPDASASEVGLIHGIESKIVLPPHIHSYEQENEYPVLEDRLPVADASTEDDQPQLQTKNLPKAEKGRKPRAIRGYQDNIPEFFLHKGSNRRTGLGYRPQNDFYSMMSAMKDIDRQDQFTDYDLHDNDFTPFSSLLLNPLPILAASFLPLSMIFAAVIPVMIRNRFSNANGNVPLVTTTATGNSGKNGEIGKNIPFLAATAEAIGKISPRNHENGCFTKALCKMVDSDKYATFYTQNVFSELQKYVDGNLLDPFGLKTVLEYLKDGKCEEIKCD